MMKPGRKLLALLAAALLLAGVSGCAQLAYLSQSAGGHLRLLASAQPVERLLQDPQTSAELGERLRLAQRLREFSVQQLQLPDNASYRRYADLRREAVVWNVVAAPELSLRLKTWCFPLMGCVGYRGYFDPAEAQAYARALQAEEPGLEVLVYPVPAYSTLGWSNWLGGDPLLSSFIRYPEGELAGLIFHELAHQLVYVADDTAFNEAFATAVERRGAQAWLAQRADAPAREAYEGRQRGRERFRALAGRYRAQLEALYRGPLSEAEKRSAKAELMRALRAEPGLGAWAAQANNASLALLAAYNELSPAFEALLDAQGGDWPRFYAEVQRLAALPKSQRQQQLLLPTKNHQPGD
ncbi:putative aminopeptidase [Paucibacter oligotrophus]|uniref:Putative aminopeptidase n=1 Tax=Roseateles oligotrophus TaxID=1769250 RepID=A0A840LGU6_9BURK|nr:aminopeptidase [Roseateles oligotrophus]MBB4845832.1 putative aminopeptidase [Roseateles oligotrophus]